MKKIFKRDVSLKSFVIFLFAISLVRLFLTYFQKASFQPDISMFDDHLMYVSARNIANGNWLGEYSYLTMGKHMLFAVWLSLLSKLGISFLFAGQILCLLSSLIFVFSLNPLIKNRILKLIFYVLLIFNPINYADFTLRLYRDNISTSISVFVFSCIIGFALRANKNNKKALWFYGILGGFMFGFAYLLREDGLWLLPFVIVGGFVSLLIIIKNKRDLFSRLLSFSMFIIIPLILISAYSFANYVEYGVFEVSDLTSRRFTEMTGALMRVSDSDDDKNPIVPLPLERRNAIYEISPAFKELEQFLESPGFSRMRKNVGDGVFEYSGGGYYWAIRNAASLSGYYTSPSDAYNYYSKIKREIDTACDEGRIAGYEKSRKGFYAPITFESLSNSLKEMLSEVYYLLFYVGFDCSPDPSFGSPQVIKEMESFTNTEGFILDKEYVDGNLLIVSAFSNEGKVYIDIVDSEGNSLVFENKPSTGGDVYVNNLLSTGEDIFESDLLRNYIKYFDSDNASIILTDGKIVYSEPISNVKLNITAGDIRFSIEYVGENFIEKNATFGFLEIWLYRLMRVFVYIYRFITPVLTVLSIAGIIFDLINRLRTRRKFSIMYDFDLLLLITFGIALMSVLRLFMIAYIEVTAFGIGTYPMYFAVSYFLNYAFILCSFLLVRKKVSFKKCVKEKE